MIQAMPRTHASPERVQKQLSFTTLLCQAAPGSRASPASRGHSQPLRLYRPPRMLSQALKGATSTSSITSFSLSASHHSASLLDCSSSVQCSFEPDAQLHASVEDDALDTPKYDDTKAGDEADEEPFWTTGHPVSDQSSPFAQSNGIDALCRSFVANNLSHRPPLAHSNSSGLEIAAANTNSSSDSSPFVGMVARSCPKPIVMPRRSRQGSLAHHDELSVFVPPHELAASSLLDPTNVSDSLCRKGSAAIRLRSGVLRRTGFLEGHTETLKPQTSATAAFRQ